MGEKRDKANSISNLKLYAIMITMLVFGTANTIVMKYQDKKVVGTRPNGDKMYYVHPFFQCANMFVGELCCLFVYFGKKLWISRKQN